MGFKLIYAVEVFDDLQENINWYNNKQAGLCSRFFKTVKEIKEYRKAKAHKGNAIRFDQAFREIEDAVK